MYVLIFSATLPETFLILRRAEQHVFINVLKVRAILVTLYWKLNFLNRFLEKIFKCEISCQSVPVGAELFNAEKWTKGQTDRQTDGRTEKDR